MAYFRTGGGTDTSDANAVAGDILLNKTAYVNDEKLTGTMPNNGAISGTIEAGETYTVPAGYTSGGTITASSAGATITVTYTSDFYNKTITCTKGTKTYTKTTTSSGSTTFNVNEEGTWTITCNGVSRTVNVVLSYSTQMAITKTVTVYSAASDTVSFTDVTGAKTVTTNTSGRGSVTISFIPNSKITFTSSKAKNPTNLSQAYSKTITMTDSITSVYVMPGKVLYWFGNEVNCYLYDTAGMTQNTNNIYMVGYPNTPCITNNTAIAMTGTSKIKTIIKDVSVGSAGEYYGFRYGTSATKQNVTTNDTLTGGDLSGTRLFQFNATNGHSYARIGAINSTVNTGTIYAMWVE